MARAGPKSKKAKPAPKSKKVEEEEEVKSEGEHVEDDRAEENNGRSDDGNGTESDEEEPPAKKGRGGKGGKAPKKQLFTAKVAAKGRARKTPAKKKAESEEEDEEDDKEYEVHYILAERTKKGVKEYQVKWKGYGVKQATWEPEDNLNCDDVIAEYKEKKEQSKNSQGKELREGPKKTERYADIAGSGAEHRQRHSKRTNNKSPRKSYRDPDSD